MCMQHSRKFGSHKVNYTFPLPHTYLHRDLLKLHNTAPAGNFGVSKHFLDKTGGCMKCSVTAMCRSEIRRNPQTVKECVEHNGFRETRVVFRGVYEANSLKTLDGDTRKVFGFSVLQ